jgi:DNA processing protein
VAQSIRGYGATAGARLRPVPDPASRPERWDQRRRLWWLLWLRCPGIGPVRLRALEARLGGLERAWSAAPQAFEGLAGWPAGLVSDLERFRARMGEDPLARLSRDLRGGRGVLLPGDPPWPAALEMLDRCPPALWWRGKGSLWRPLGRRAAIAVVGTRRPSSHGLAMAHRLGVGLARAGWPVVSGLAEGIDAEVHRGVLAAGGAPVAVLGTPLERVYPRHHHQLQQQVARCGLLISEQAPGSAVLAGHFASRNRLLVALARAVVVVECPVSSGALHSAELAWRQELPLWVVPADAARLSAVGSNRLLARGATPLLEPGDLISQLGHGPMAELGESPVPRPLPSRQAALLAAVGGGASLEQLSLVLGEAPTQLATQLLELEIAGHLRAEAGLCWRPA